MQTLNANGTTALPSVGDYTPIQLSSTETFVLWTSLAITIVLYLGLLVWGCVNVYRYLFR